MTHYLDRLAALPPIRPTKCWKEGCTDAVTGKPPRVRFRQQRERDNYNLGYEAGLILVEEGKAMRGEIRPPPTIDG